MKQAVPYLAIYADHSTRVLQKLLADVTGLIAQITAIALSVNHAQDVLEDFNSQQDHVLSFRHVGRGGQDVTP